MKIIKSIEHVKGLMVRVAIGADTPGPTPITMVEIHGDDYEALMSERPAWAPNKPADTFREDDLLHFIGDQL